MPRPREFDEQQVLDRALEVFWAKGFDGATLPDLEAATGLRRASLYCAFGDKRGLFLRAVERYLQGQVLERLAALEAPDAGRETIAAFFRRAAAEATCPRRRGCLFTNCAVELAPADAEIAAQVARNLGLFEHAFEAALRRAKANGEIAPDSDPRRLARFLTLCLQGLQVMARLGGERRWVDDAVAAALAALR